MAENAKCFVSPSLDFRQAVSALLRMKENLAPLDKGRVCFLLHPDERLKIIAPANPGVGAAVAEADYAEAVDALMSSVTSEGVVFQKSLGAKTVDLEPLPRLSQGLLILLLKTEVASSDDIAAPTDHEKAIFIESPSVIASLGEEIVRACPMARAWPSVTGEGNDAKDALLFLVNDDLSRDSALPAMIAGMEPSAALVAERYDTAAGPVFLPVDRSFSRQLLIDVGTLLRAALGRDAAADGGALCVFEPDGVPVILTGKRPIDDARDFGFDDLARTGLSWRYVDLQGSEAAAGRLRKAVAEVDPDAGYRLTLHDASAELDGSIKLENLEEQIAELEAQAALIRGLGAPRMMLLRFTRRQLPAMADLLTTAPVSAIDGGVIHYGFQATAEEPGGVHYLLFTLGDVPFDRPFEEWLWRRRTEDAPIRYWLDPHWARHYFDHSSSVRSRVFVPHATFLHPTLHSFGPGDMDAYLRSLIAARLTESERSKAFRARLSDPTAEIGLIFSHSREEGFEIAIDVVDFGEFRPLRERLDWINKNLMMIDPAFVEEARISEIASSLYSGALAKSLLGEMQGVRSELQAGADRQEAALTARLEALAERFADEFNEAQAYSLELAEHIATLATRFEAMDQILAEVEGASKGLDQDFARLPDAAADLEAQRDVLQDALLREHTEAQDFLQTADAKFQRLKQQLEDLSERIRKVRRNG